MDLADVIKKHLLKACKENKILLEDCYVKAGKLCFKVRKKGNKIAINNNVTVEKEIPIQEVNISEIIKRIKSILK